MELPILPVILYEVLIGLEFKKEQIGTDDEVKTDYILLHSDKSCREAAQMT